MKPGFQSESALADESSPAPLDLVIPVTTPELTRASIRAAEHLASGINGSAQNSPRSLCRSDLLEKRAWRTHNERLAADLRRAAYPVILTFESDQHA